MRLAVANDTETLHRLSDPLAERDIYAEHVSLSRTVTALSDPGVDDFDAGFVFPGRIPEGGVLQSVLGVPWLNSREAVLTSRNKAAVTARLARAGVPVPDSVVVSHPTETEDLTAAVERFDPPVVIKPNSATRGVGVAKVHDTDSLLGVADYLDLVHDYRATADKTFLVQEFLPDAVDYRVMVLDGEYAGAVKRELPAEAEGWKHNVHRGATATAVDLDDDLRDLAESVADVLDIDFLGVDLLVSDDRAVVTETNARPTVDSFEKYEPDFLDRLVDLLRDLP
ncbi:ATP-grasp domain-containing protein [Halocalculus aciditolerans]|uniref:RimK family alpha-L-glutamate ligase n=1 Tax=Halocalculus aciditolerans TaxID=1383812 RepID=A0A830F6W5_9EURY|nr:ATP-grasp domain-containing protein [Halocalculus aciditolerans]GGL69393.1 RimK family alpha-L-glutamate ligase [Halocalculus aciditolerans]